MKERILRDFREIDLTCGLSNGQQLQAEARKMSLAFFYTIGADLSWATSFSTAAWSAMRGELVATGGVVVVVWFGFQLRAWGSCGR